MKKLFILLLIIPILGFSQNDLVFNQVSIVVLDFNGITVPDGKVWKIESADGQYLLVDDDNWELGRLGSYNNMPAWFPEGTILKKGSGSSTGSSPISRLSVLEFNVVPVGSSSGNGGDTGDSGNSNNNDDNGFNNSTSSGEYDGSQTNFSSYGDDFTDVEGNTYSTAIIGNLVWTTSNANHSTYRDGTPIPYISNLDEWNSSTTGAYTYLNQDESLGYGKIYNWFAIIGQHDNDQNTENKVFAPVGWRVPSRINWESIISIFNFGSDNSKVGTWNAFKSTTGWLTYNGNNHSKLNMKPNGYISAWNQTYYGFNDLNLIYGGTQTGDLINEYGSRFWTSTIDWQFPTSRAYGFEIYDQDDYGSLYQLSSQYFQGNALSQGYINSGNYVRLVKDAN